MFRPEWFLVLLFGTSVFAAPLPPNKVFRGGILALGDFDNQDAGQKAERDKLALFDPKAKPRFRISNLDQFQTNGSNRLIAVDSRRKAIWVAETAAKRLRVFDFLGNEILKIESVAANSIAVDPDTGNLWVLVGNGSVGQSRTVVYSPKGLKIATHPIGGVDIVFDQRSRCFWIADQKLNRINPADGATIECDRFADWCCSSLDVDAKTGEVWTTVRGLKTSPSDTNRLVKFNAKGQKQFQIELGDKIPVKVSVSPVNGNVWVAYSLKGVALFSPKGESLNFWEMPALSVQSDPVSTSVWVCTIFDLRQISERGERLERFKFEKKATRAWMALME